MKAIIKKALILPIFLVLLFTSCQDEVIETNQEDPQETFTASSNIASLLLRTSTNDGSRDNIIDGANCLNIQLPVTVFVNGLEIIIDSEEDFEVIEAIFDQLDDDDDTLEILFPITIILHDYTEIVIQNQNQLEEYISECFDDDDDIECVDFVYPITYSVFNSNTNSLNTVTINNDREMYRFIESLEPADLVSLNFPVTLIFFNGETLEVYNNEELVSALERAINYCDEDDDDDYGDDDFTIERLNDLLISCPWIVHVVERNEDDLTDVYRNFIVNFFESGEVTVRRLNGETHEGTWELMETDDGVSIQLSFDTLVDFTLTWFVYDVGNDQIKLYNEGGNHIILELYCNDNTIECTEEVVDSYLMDCHWNVVNLNGSDDLIIFELDFKDNQSLEITNTSTNEVINATWSTSQSTDGVILEFNNVGGANIQAISGNWLINECEDGRFSLNNDASDEMVIEKDCDDNQSTNDLVDIIIDGHWIVTNYNNDNVSETENYDGYQFTFNTDGIVVAVNDTNTFAGSWSTTIDGGQLTMILEFGNQAPLDEFNDDWDVFNFDIDRVILEDESDNDVLVFEKV